MIKDEVDNAYFEWLYNIVCGDIYSENFSYRKLLMHLHKTTFTYLIARDENRAEDGLGLRYRFSLEYDIVKDADEYINEPCSVLEMMIALAVRCEENIMDDPEVGDRTRQWFWRMITNLGLGDMHDDIYDKRKVTRIIKTFLDREYEPDGRGGLFVIKNCDHDLRDIEIWWQLCWYLDTIT